MDRQWGFPVPTPGVLQVGVRMDKDIHMVTRMDEKLKAVMIATMVLAEEADQGGDLAIVSRQLLSVLGLIKPPPPAQINATLYLNPELE